MNERCSDQPIGLMNWFRKRTVDLTEAWTFGQPNQPYGPDFFNGLWTKFKRTKTVKGGSDHIFIPPYRCNPSLRKDRITPDSSSCNGAQ